MIARVLLVAALGALAFRPGLAVQYTGKAPVRGTSSILGKVVAADGKSAARQVRVLAYHLSSETTFVSEPTDRKGEFRIPELPFGYFDLAVETPEGLFVANRVVNVAPNSKAEVIFTLRPYRGAAASEAREYPGREGLSQGEARFKEKARGRAFWRSPRGVAVLAGLGSAGLLAIASSSDETEITPFLPSNP